MKSMTAGPLLAGLAALGLAGMAATYSDAGWDDVEPEPTTIEGEIDWIEHGPGRPVLRVATRSGEGWIVQLTDATMAEAAGFTPGAAQSGDPVEVLGHRLTDVEGRRLQAVSITVDGADYVIHRGRIPAAD